MPSLRRRPLPLRVIAPNIITVLAMCTGVTAVRLAYEGRFELAAIMILVAGLFDGLDGRIARMLRGSTKFGAELDSLSDVVNFGVVPSFTLYFWVLKEGGGFGWIAVLAFIICAALRLARFNTALDDPHQPAWKANFFTGIPTTIAAFLALMPMYMAFALDWEGAKQPQLISIYLLVLAGLMVSRVPAFSFKKIRIERGSILFVLLGVGFAAAVLVSYPWGGLFGLGALYVATLPIAWRRHKKYEADQATGKLVVEDEDRPLTDDALIHSRPNPGPDI